MNLANLIRTKSAIYTGERWACGLPTYDAMYAGYLLGTDYWDGTTFGPATDITQQDRDLTFTGAPGAKFLDAPANLAILPFSADDLCARTGGCTLVAVSQVAPNVNAAPISDFVIGSANSIALGTPTNAAVNARQLSATTTRQALTSVAAASRSGFNFLAAAFSEAATTAWASSAGAGLAAGATSTSPTVPAPGGENPLRVGAAASGMPGANQTAAVFFYDRVLTDPEMAALFAKVTLLLAGGGLAVSQ